VQRELRGFGGFRGGYLRNPGELGADLTPKLTAGRRLRADLDAMLDRARDELREPGLSWDEREQDIISRAAAAADRADDLRAAFDAELSGENRATVLCKLSAEVRACDRAVVDLVAKVNPDVGSAPSERHVRAAKSRWDRRFLRSV
jgi:hypothetical protein